MSDQRLDCESRLSESNKRYLCSSDSDDNRSVCSRKKVHYEDERQDEANDVLEELAGCGEQDAGKEAEEIGGEEEVPIDRLSALPDSLILRILSFIDIKDASMTSVLSKRWQCLWPDSPRLNFYLGSREPEIIRKFVAWVNRTLVISTGNHLEKFAACFSYDKSYASDVDNWIVFAVKNNAKEVILTLNSWQDSYMLPQAMYSNSSLTSLSLEGCIMNPRGTVEWGSLTTLRLEWMDLHQRVIEEILSGCPVLTHLALIGCQGINYMEVHSQSLQSLRISDVYELEISAPVIRSLSISLFEGMMLQVTNMSSLVSASIRSYGFDCYACSEKEMRCLKELFEIVQHVEKLELGGGCLEVLPMLEASGWRLPQSGRRHLIVTASADGRSVPGIIGLLESSPNIEMLVIDGTYDEPYEVSDDDGTTGESYMKSQSYTKADLSCDLLHPKTIRIVKFDCPDLDGQPMLMLVQLLLKRAKVLEEMTIHLSPAPPCWEGYYLRITAMLLGYSRSSPKAVILLR